MPDSTICYQISQSYAVAPWTRAYIALKLAWDPLFDVACEHIRHQNQQVLDIGCGFGLLGMTMRKSTLPLRYRGIDTDIGKLNINKEAVRYFGFSEVGFEANDATNTQIPEGVTVCLFDVLHCLDRSSQDQMLNRVADAAANGSMVLIRTKFQCTSWRYIFTLTAKLLRLATLSMPIHFPSRVKLLELFEKRGLQVDVLTLKNDSLWGQFIIIRPSIHANPALKLQLE
jgi:SAM-dependent methyltransferase